MNFLVRVVTRRRSTFDNKLITDTVMNHVFVARNSAEARRLARKEWGHLALIGLIRKTKLEPGCYIPEEKVMV